MALTGIFRFILNHPLNRREKARAVINFLWWQTRSRLLPQPMVYDWFHDVKLNVHPDETSLTKNVYCSLADFPEMCFLLHALREHKLFCDVGANSGAYTILAAAGRQARVQAFEPTEQAYRRLTGNVELNRVSHLVTAHNLAVSDREQELVLTQNLDATNHVVAAGEKATHTAKIQAVSLDQTLGGEVPHILKIDVEGYESAVIDGAGNTLRDPTLQTIIVEASGLGEQYGFDEAGLEDTLQENGFESCLYDPFSRSLEAIAPSENKARNLLCIRNQPAMLDRLAAGPGVRIKGVEV